MAVSCALTCWFAPVVGVLVTLFYDHAEPVEAGKKKVRTRGKYRIGNPISGGGQAVPLTNLSDAGLKPASNTVFNGERMRGEEGVRAVIRLRKKNSLLILRRFAERLRGRTGMIAQAALQTQLETDRRRIRDTENVLQGLEGEVDPEYYLLVAEGQRSLIERGISSAAPEQHRLEEMANHLEAAIQLGHGDSYVVNRYIEALIRLENFEEAYRVVMECSVIDGVPVRLHLARIRAAQGQWSGINSLTSDLNNRDWGELSSESKAFWGF